MNKIICTLLSLISFLPMSMTARELTRYSTIANTPPDSLVPMAVLSLLPRVVYGYPNYFTRTETGVIVNCQDAASPVCFETNPETGVGCIDPGGCNPNIGPTYFPLRKENDEYYEVLFDDGDCRSILIYTPAGYERHGG
jgi:hypothetical protein